MREAMASGDAAAIASLLTNDFRSIDVHGRTIDARAMISRVLRLKIDRSKRTVRTVLTAIVERDGEAFVEQHYTMTSAEDAPKSMPRSLLTLSNDHWRNVDGRWLLASTDTREIEVVTGAGRRRRYRK